MEKDRLLKTKSESFLGYHLNCRLEFHVKYLYAMQFPRQPALRGLAYTEVVSQIHFLSPCIDIRALVRETCQFAPIAFGMMSYQMEVCDVFL